MNLTQRNIAIGISLVVAAAVVYFFRNIVAYVLIAWVVSMLGQPIMRFLQARVRIGKRHLPPSVCALLVMSFFFFVLVSLVLIFVPLVVEQTNNLSHLDYNAFAVNLQQPLAELTELGQKFGMIRPNENVIDMLQHTFNNWISASRVKNFFLNPGTRSV